MLVVTRNVDNIIIKDFHVLVFFFSLNILMEDSTIRECKISFLQHEYIRYSKLIYGHMQHIEKLYREGFIQPAQRLSALSVLNHLIRYMNQDVYNTKLKELKAGVGQVGQVGQVDQYNKNNIENIDKVIKLQEFDINKDNTNAQVQISKSSDELEVQCETDSQDQDNEYVKFEFGASPGNSNKMDVSILDKHLHEVLDAGPFQYALSTNIDTLLDICRIGKIGSLNNIMFDDFNKVAEKLIKVGNDVGFKSIHHALELLIGCSHQEFIKNSTIEDQDNSQEQDKLKEFRDMLSLINDSFIPTKFICINNYVQEPFSIECSINDNPPTELFLQTYATVVICFPNTEKKFQFDGYFTADSIQCLIRTCQIGKPFLYKKKKQLQSYIEDIKFGFINQKFSNIYVKNMSIGEVLSYTKDQFISKLHADFDRYVRLSKMTFRSLMEEFTRDNHNNLKNMYMVIKLLLLGPDDCINMAGLLFGLTKDKKIGSEVVAELIYNNLSLPLQIKLKKTATNIKNEIDKIKSLSDEDVPLEKVVAANSKIPSNIKKIILSKLHELKTQNTENSKNKLYADTLIRFPHINDDTTFIDLNKDQKRSCEFMSNVMEILNEKIYGHSECKNAIKELICSWILNPSKMGKTISLCGPPGVGKTLIAKALGKAIGVPVRCISLCGMEDGSVLNGHSFTYSNAQPGMLVREMCEAGKARCILFFDEVDKTSKRHGIDEIQNILITLTDPNMCDKFNDKFIQDIQFNFSHVLIICTYNNKSAIDPILLNRLHEIEVKPYTIKDKLKISKNFLLKEVTEDISLENGSIKIDESDVKYLIENYTYESGVRELRRLIETLFLKLNVDRLYRKGVFYCECKKASNKECTCDQCGLCDKCNSCLKCNTVCNKNCKIEITKQSPITITREMINKYLSRPKIHFDKIHSYPAVGIVNGLYATTYGGGGLVQIVVQKNLSGGSNFDLNLTGSQGKVMKESVNFARTTAMNLINEKYITDFINNNKSGTSVHALDGATNKDGPSAGCAFTTAFISLILGKKIRNDIAMTGEIGIHGECKEIGGLVSKLYGAKKAGVKLVCIPKANEHDLEDIMKDDPELIEKDKFEVKICESMHDVLPLVMVDGFDVTEYLNALPIKISPPPNV